LGAAMLLSRFFRSRDGNVLPIFAAAVVPVIGLIGAAIDYSRASSIRTEMQGALDATALMLSKAAPGLSKDDLQKLANSYFQAQFTRKDANGVQVAASYTNASGDQQVKVDATGDMTTDFMKLLGISKMNIGNSSTVKWGQTKLRVALALDNTGSMNDSGKIGALKTATKGLLTQLQTAAKNPGDVQVSIVPFSKDVNVGAPNPLDVNWKAPSWIDWTDWDEENGHDTSATTCSGKGKKKKCTTSTTWIPDDHKTWNGCVTDRTQDYDVKNTTPDTKTVATLFPAEQYDYCPVSMLGLSNDWVALNAKLDSMIARGNTNQTIGLAWAWQTLTQNAPMNATGLPADTAQFIILLSDGMNTENRVSDVQSDIDARMKKLCENIKAENKGTKTEIRIFTVLVMAGNSSVLQDCASDKSMYFALTSANDMVTTFNQIGTSLANLRIAK
jgi:Flp pilus assembly protein TadG